MAPALVLLHRSSGRHFRRLRRQAMNPPHHPAWLPSVPRSEQTRARSQDVAPPASTVLDGPLPSPIAPTSTSVVLGPEPSVIPNNQSQGSNLFADIPGNIVAAVVVVVLILSGLIGLVVGGEMIRRRTKARGIRVSRPPSSNARRRKSELAKNATDLLHQRTLMARQKFPYDEKTLTPLTRPPPVFNRERLRLSDIWPIRSFSMAVNSHLSCPAQVDRSVQHSPPLANPHTTWSEFSLASPYVAPPRTILACIPEELEDSQSYANSDLEAILGITFQQSPESGSAMPSLQANNPRSSMLRNTFNHQGPSVVTERRGPQDRHVVYEIATSDEDSKSLGSSAPEMTSDGGESSRSSMASLESLEDGNERESLGEEVFELRRAQTRSMQMNKGVLLALGLKALDDDGQTSESTHEECDPSSASSTGGGKGCTVERLPSLVMLSGKLSAVNLDEFPSPPSILPMIPSFLSGF